MPQFILKLGIEPSLERHWRPCSEKDVLKLCGLITIEYTLDRNGTEKFWKKLTSQP
ncbi:MAG: hypothetical protein AAF944_22425 [Bacteroidota bacterium]